MKIAAILLCGALWLSAGEYYYMNGDRRVDLQEVPSAAVKHSLKGGVLYFEKRDGEQVGVVNRIIVKFASMENFEDYLQRFNLKQLKKYSFGNMYLLEAPTPKDAIDAANALYEQPDVLFAQPDLIRHWSLR